jgi:hypothetical protein
MKVFCGYDKDGKEMIKDSWQASLDLLHERTNVVRVKGNQFQHMLNNKLIAWA